MTYGYDLPAGSVAFVTGAASGLGAMSALVLAEAGCSNLVLVDVSADGLAETAKQTGLKEENLLVKAMDLRKDAEVAALFGEIESRFGRLDYAVNAAGVMGRTFGSLLEIEQDDWDFVIDVNLRCIAVLNRHQIRLMMKNKRVADEQVGSIVNFGSWACWHGHESTPHYTASKAALLGLNNCLCVRHARDGIRVNGVAPGVIETPMFKPEYRESYKLDKIPAGRFGKPREVAEVVLFLCSPRSSFVNGAMIPIDGGMNSL